MFSPRDDLDGAPLVFDLEGASRVPLGGFGFVFSSNVRLSCIAVVRSISAALLLFFEGAVIFILVLWFRRRLGDKEGGKIRHDVRINLPHCLSMLALAPLHLMQKTSYLGIVD